VGYSPTRVSGPLQLAGQLQWKQELANGQIWVSGTNLSMRDLVFRQLSSQCAISNNILYVNDLRAVLNDSDYVNATGRLNLRRPYYYAGKISTNVAHLATLQPLLRASGNQNELAGSLTVDWEGEGQGVMAAQPSGAVSIAAQSVVSLRNSGKLKLVLQKGRYGNLQSLQANVDAAYSPEGLDVPIIFFATSSMDFQAIARTKGDTLEIDKIQLNQVWIPPRRETRRNDGNKVGTDRRAVRSGGAPPPDQRAP